MWFYQRKDDKEKYILFWMRRERCSSTIPHFIKKAFRERKTELLLLRFLLAAFSPIETKWGGR
jgi:hypothetical protein